MKVRELQNHLSTYDPDESVAYMLWTRPDVIGYCRHKKLAMTPEVADNILEMMDSHSDCEWGMTWTTLETTIDIKRDECPSFWKLYWRSEDGDVLGYECDHLRTVYFMLDAGVPLPEAYAWELGFHFLRMAGYDDKLDNDDDFWTIIELEKDDEIWDVFGDVDEDDDYDDARNKMWDLLTNPVVLWVNGNGKPYYTTPRCPECGKDLESIDDVYHDTKRYTWDHDKNAIITSKHIGEPATDRYECPECCADISDYFWQFDITWDL